ncbi:MAG: IMP dehydrogenase [SAR324 cluster bacterium]|nr:IMP dehydrogenase [SAR324 cluster bacterium]
MLKERMDSSLTFDDILLVPGFSEILPAQCAIETRLSRNLTLNIPLISAAMDTLTEYQTAIAMAQEGGIGIIHKNMPISEHARHVEQVKRSESGMITDPITVSPSQPVRDALDLMQKHHISGVPVTQGKELVGILTNRDLRFETNFELRVEEVMTRGRDKLVTVSPGIDLEDAKKLLHRYRIEKLLVVSEEYELVGLITIKDIEKSKQYPHANKDDAGRLRVGAAVGVSADLVQRVDALIQAEVDVVVVDTAHGHSKGVLESIMILRSNFPNLEIIGGNIATGEAALALIKAGVDAVKVGIGPGSICTTRVVAGTGVPQITAIDSVLPIAEKYDIPIISDGGIKFSGDVVKALACGAHSVMIGSALAGTSETPGSVVLYQGRRYKMYRGMGSLGAMKEGSKDRYFQTEVEDMKLVPEGIEARVPYKGPLSETLHQFIGGLRAGMGYTGCQTIEELRTKPRFVKITNAGLKESHVHDVFITEEAPNYPSVEGN